MEEGRRAHLDSFQPSSFVLRPLQRPHQHVPPDRSQAEKSERGRERMWEQGGGVDRASGRREKVGRQVGRTMRCSRDVS